MKATLTQLWLALLMAGATVLPVSGQTPQSLKILARATPDAVLLRWAPTSPLVWQLGNQHGYTLEKIAVEEQNSPTVNVWHLKPLPLEQWEPLVKKDKRAAVAAQAIYGDSFETTGFTSTAEELVNTFSEAENRHGFALMAVGQSFAIAQAAGLGLKDSAVVAGKAYVYRAWLALPQGAPVVSDTVAVYVKAGQVLKLPPIEGVKASFEDKAVRVSWPTLFHKGLYNAYQIERSQGKDAPFVSATALPFANLWKTSGEAPQKAFFADTLAVNGTPYCYRVRGLTSFGELGPPSTPVCGQGIPETPAAEIDSAYTLEETQAVLRWRFPNELEMAIKGFQVLRAAQPKGPYQPVAPKLLLVNTRAYVDTTQVMESYYQVVAVNKNGLKKASNPVYVAKEDNQPPKAPVGLMGHIDSLGIVRLSWQPSPEKDVMGYQVFKANRPGAEFVAASPQVFTKPRFTDTLALNTLTRHAYYTVIALDKRWNKSAYAKAVKLERPDNVPPAPLAFVGAKQNEAGALCLEWVPSPSQDIKEVFLFKATSRLETLLAFHPSAGLQAYCDTSFAATKGGSYLLLALDSAGNRSPMAVFKAGHPGKAANKPVVTATIAQGGVALTWEATQAKMADSFQVYKAVNGGPMRLTATLEGKQNAYLDQQAQPNNAYAYWVKAFFKDGTPTALGKPVQVNY